MLTNHPDQTLNYLRRIPGHGTTLGGGVPGSNPHRGVCEMSVRLYNRLRGRTFICRSGPSRTQGGVGVTNFLFLPPSPSIFTRSCLGFTMFWILGSKEYNVTIPQPAPPLQKGWTSLMDYWVLISYDEYNAGAHCSMVFNSTFGGYHFLRFAHSPQNTTI